MKAIIVLAALVIAGSVQAATIENEIIVQDNGNAIVVMKINSTRLVEFNVPSDVKELRVKGALYLQDQQRISLSPGAEGQAAVLYTSSLLTQKNGNNWEFSMDLTGINITTVALPNNTILSSTSPPALVSSEGFLTLHWENIEGKATANYSFKSLGNPEVTIDETNGTKHETKGAGNDMALFSGFSILAVASIGGYLYMRRKESMKSKESVIRTLSENQQQIVRLLIENAGEMKRSHLEAKTGLAKSSLALSLADLEKKKIVEVDRGFSAHFVRFTRWFNEL